ncbi:hypothetical protein PGT21_020424 [Puccinia graminis f. sp. tritici]|uniref:Uncharacterized protein n=2 Tax=Puccinia graminis f. sp. tritici TaxID=56615 RepID=E3KFA8_PUCGT|nr:uncharacterized protein PGTG_09903 [Puccinia graminis f. sp. tritici CRL 75-36-700-3]EFP82935.2 hypothetical protein PGTG_09903 [Puccinia graminis f. sp. tritici CRL 75-36-700-3]KAA1069307.1 hypothetical protein PGT21_020424 [Puccinia graminis f. sp. tritici]
MPFPLFSNPFHKPNNLSSSTRSQQHPNPPQTSYSHNRTKPISHRSNHSTSSSTNDHPVLRPVALNNFSPTSSAITCPEPITQPQPTSIRTRTQSLATTRSKIRTTSNNRPATASQDPSFKSESTQLIKKLKSYGPSPSDRPVPSTKKAQTRPPPISLSNQLKPQHIRTHRPTGSAGNHPTPPSPRSRSASAAATVFDIVRPSRRRDGNQNSSTITPFTPPLPVAPSISSLRTPADPPQRDRTKSNRLPPSPLSIHRLSTSRPNAHRRASSLDSITAEFPPPRSPHQQYFKNSGFIQTSRKFSACSSQVSPSEFSEEIITQTSRPSTAHTSPLSSANPRSRFSPRDNRQLAAPQGLKPRLINSASSVSLSPKSPFPSKLARPGEPYSPKLLEPVEITSSGSTANWTLNVSGSSTFEPTVCLVPDLPGTILRLRQTPTDNPQSLLEPHLKKIIKIGVNGNELVEWEIRLAAPTRPRLNSSRSNHDLPPQPSPRTRLQSKSRIHPPKLVMNNDSRQVGPAGGSQSTNALHDSSHSKSNVNPSTSVITLNLNTFRASDIKELTAPASTNAPRKSNQVPSQAPSSLLSLFPSTTSPAKSVQSQRSVGQARSPSPASSASNPSSPVSLVEEETLETEDDELPIGKGYRRKRFDTYVAPVNRQTASQAQQSGSDQISHQSKIESKSRRSFVHPDKNSHFKLKTEDNRFRMNNEPTEDSIKVSENHQLAFNLERQLAHSKLLGLSDEGENKSNLKKPRNDELESNENQNLNGLHHFHQQNLNRNSNCSSNLDRNSLMEKSYWSETDTATSSSIVNFRIFNDDQHHQDDDHDLADV